jgi:hypothetical protein
MGSIFRKFEESRLFPWLRPGVVRELAERPKAGQENDNRAVFEPAKPLGENFVDTKLLGGGVNSDDGASFVS